MVRSNVPGTIKESFQAFQAEEASTLHGPGFQALLHVVFQSGPMLVKRCDFEFQGLAQLEAQSIGARWYPTFDVLA